MGWLIAIPALLVGVIIKHDILILVSGLYAIAGSIGSLAVSIKMKMDEDKAKQEKTKE